MRASKRRTDAIRDTETERHGRTYPSLVSNQRAFQCRVHSPPTRCRPCLRRRFPTFQCIRAATPLATLFFPSLPSSPGATGHPDPGCAISPLVPPLVPQRLSASSIIQADSPKIVGQKGVDDEHLRHHPSVQALAIISVLNLSRSRIKLPRHTIGISHARPSPYI